MREDNQDYRLKANYYRPTYSKPPKKPPRNRGKLLLSLFAVGLVALVVTPVVFAGRSGLKHEVDSVKNDVASITADNTTQNDTDESASINTMGQIVNGIIAGSPDIDISVSLIDLDNNQSEHYGVNEPFLAGSTAKILTAEYFLHEVEAGRQSLTETISGDTAQYELQQMIVVSNDDAWEDLNEMLGYNNIQDYAEDTFGINDYQAYNNSLSSNDIALALQGLWEGKVLDHSDTQLLLSYLKETNYRQFIVPAIPSGDTIYHKAGLYEDYVNDAAIITHGKQAFALAIFTNGNGQYNWPARATMMQQITRAALKAYFNEG